MKKYTKSNLIGIAEDALNENRGWWIDDTREDQDHRDDIDKTLEVLASGKLKDPYGAIEDAADDYKKFLEDSDDSDFDPDDTKRGAKIKQERLDEFQTMLDDV